MPGYGVGPYGVGPYGGGLIATVQTTAADGTPVARVLLELTWPGIETVLIERLDPDGEWRPVRNAEPAMCLGSMAIHDHEAPLDQPVSYRATSPQGSGAVNSNPFFETTTDPWIGANGGSIALSAVQAHEGVQSLRLTPDGTHANTQAGSDLVAVTPRVVYGAEAWLWSTAAATWRVIINWYDVGGSLLTSSTVASQALAAGTWTHLSGEDDAPAGAVFARLVINASGTPASSNRLYIDEAMLTSPEPMTLTSGTVTVPSGGMAWLSHPGHPQYAAARIVNDVPTAVYPGRSGSFWPIGAQLPIAVTDVRGGAQGTIIWQEMTTAEYRQMRAMIRDGGVLLMRLPEAWSGDTWYILAGDIAEVRYTGVGVDPQRRYQMPYDQRARPTGLSDGALGETWDDVAAAYGTWDDLLATGKSWAELEQSVT
jgi:hypothetical protein